VPVFHLAQIEFQFLLTHSGASLLWATATPLLASHCSGLGQMEGHRPISDAWAPSPDAGRSRSFPPPDLLESR